jgi:hypothetical protein
MLAHLRTEAYPVYGKSVFEPGQWTSEKNLTVEKTQQAIQAAKERVEWDES